MTKPREEMKLKKRNQTKSQVLLSLIAKDQRRYATKLLGEIKQEAKREAFRRGKGSALPLTNITMPTID